MAARSSLGRITPRTFSPGSLFYRATSERSSRPQRMPSAPLPIFTISNRGRARIVERLERLYRCEPSNRGWPPPDRGGRLHHRLSLNLQVFICSQVQLAPDRHFLLIRFRLAGRLDFDSERLRLFAHGSSWAERIALQRYPAYRSKELARLRSRVFAANDLVA